MSIWGLRRSDLILLFMLSSGFAISGYHLFKSNAVEVESKDYNAKSLGIIKPIGTDIRIKGESENDWGHIKAVTRVFKKDKIFTGSNSKATVNLKNKDSITIEPNSLIVLQEKEDHNEIDLNAGSFFAYIKKGSHLLLKFKGKETKITTTQESEVKIDTSKKNSINLLVVKGEATVTRQTSEHVPEKTTIQASEKIEISAPVTPATVEPDIVPNDVSTHIENTENTEQPTAVTALFQEPSEPIIPPILQEKIDTPTRAIAEEPKHLDEKTTAIPSSTIKEEKIEIKERSVPPGEKVITKKIIQPVENTTIEKPVPPTEAIVIEKPIPKKLSPEETSKEKLDDKLTNSHRFNFYAKYRLTELSINEPESGAKGLLVSSNDIELGATAFQSWSQLINTYFNINFRQISFEPPREGSKNLLSKDKNPIGFASGLIFKVSDQFNLITGLGVLQNIFVRGSSSESLTIDLATIPFFDFQCQYMMFKKNDTAFGITLSSKYLFSNSSSSSLEINSGYQYSGDWYMAYHSANHSLQFNMGYESSKQNTKDVNHTINSYMLKLMYSIPFNLGE